MEIESCVKIGLYKLLFCTTFLFPINVFDVITHCAILIAVKSEKIVQRVKLSEGIIKNYKKGGRLCKKISNGSTLTLWKNL